MPWWGAQGSQKRASDRSPRAGVTGDSEIPSVGAGTQLGSSGKAVSIRNYCTVSSAPVVSHCALKGSILHTDGDVPGTLTLFLQLFPVMLSLVLISG